MPSDRGIEAIQRFATCNKRATNPRDNISYLEAKSCDEIEVQDER